VERGVCHSQYTSMKTRSHTEDLSISTILFHENNKLVIGITKVDINT
jgi:hypothetical protein